MLQPIAVPVGHVRYSPSSGYKVAKFHTSPSVLVVEDDPMIALQIEDILLEMGCRLVGPCYSLSDCAEGAADRHLDFALLDFDLGVGDR